MAKELFTYLHHPALPALECYVRAPPLSLSCPAPNNQRTTGVGGCVQDLLEVIVVPSGPAEDVIQAVRSVVDEYYSAMSSPPGQVLFPLRWKRRAQQTTLSNKAPLGRYYNAFFPGEPSACHT